MNVLNIFNKVGDAVKVVKEVTEAVNVLLEDADHNGKPDIIEKLQAGADLITEKGKAALEEGKKLGAELQVIGGEVKELLDKVRKGKK